MLVEIQVDKLKNKINKIDDQKHSETKNSETKNSETKETKTRKLGGSGIFRGLENKSVSL